MSTYGMLWEKEMFRGWNGRRMMKLVRWDDRGEEMNQEEADQDVADEVSEEVDSRGEVTRSEKND